MANYEEINLDALEQVVGGVYRNVNTGTEQNAAVKSAPGSGKVIGSLPNGSVVNTIGVPVFDAGTNRNWIQIEFTDSHGKAKQGWIATSILGLAR
ncbi:MAG: hypothetical protein IJ124_02595 [Clostridia bacterium]|nr:hypothetical protein [Clostridia bacterium]